MRIESLDLIAFGPFTDRTLDFSGGAQGLHLVFGPNEAGKSSALRAIQQFFATIPKRSTDKFLATHKELRIGMTLSGRDGAPRALIRRKGDKNTLLRPDQTPEDESVITRLLGGMSVDEFLRKSVIDHAELVEGGKAIVTGKGGLGETLFAAGSAFGGIKDVLEKLNEDAEKLYNPRGRNPEINVSLALLKEKNERVKSTSLRGSDWTEIVEKRDAAERRKEALRRARDDAQREHARLERRKEAIDPARTRAALMDELASLAAVPRLRPNFSKERTDAQSSLRMNEAAVASESSRIETLRRDLQSIDVPEPLLAEADAIEELYERRARQFAARDARVQNENELLRLQGDARTCLHAIGRDPATFDAGFDISDLESLRLAVVTLRPEVQDLEATQRSCQQAVAQSEDALRTLDAKQASAREKLESLGPARDAASLKKALDRAKKLGEPEKERAEKVRKFARAETAAVKDLKTLAPWSGTLDDLETLAFPSVETVESFGLELQQAKSDASALAEKLQTLDDDARQTAAELEQLRLGGDVPTEVDLTEARRHRDQLWSRFAASRTWDDALAAAIETAWRHADDLADRLRLQADRVAQRARLVAESGHQNARRRDLNARIARASADLDAINARWSSLWSPFGMPQPADPAAMRRWLDRRAKLAETARILADARAELSALDTQINTQRQALGAALSALGEQPDGAGESLADLIERAEDIMESVRLDNNDRKKLFDKIETLDHDRLSLKSKYDSSIAERNTWEARRAAVMRRLDLPDNAAPAVAASVLDQTKLLFDHIDRARRLRGELDAAGIERDRFQADVHALAARIAPDLVLDSAFDPAAVALDLHRRLQDARQAASRRDDLRAQLRVSEHKLESARALVDVNQRAIDALCLEAACQDPADLPTLETDAARRDQWEEQRHALDAQLARLARTTPLAEFLVEVQNANPDALDQQLHQIAEQMADLDRQLNATLEEAASLNAQIHLMNGNADAAEIGQEIADLEAKIKRDAGQYAVLRLASAVLGEAIERYRQKAQGPVLERASHFFSRFTLGSFAKLEADYNKNDELVLFGVRADGQKIGVESMSLGTADQLYLALRLAALEVDLTHREPLPLVVDDILIQFDDARTSATLAVLAELSQHTQILMFTHHHHIEALAVSAVPADSLFFHTLG